MKLKKANLKYIAMILLFSMTLHIFFTDIAYGENKKISIYVDDVEIKFSDETGRPFEENNRILIPVRVISEQMGLDVQYIHAKDLITIKDGRNIISMTVGSNIAKFNDQSLKIDENKKVVPFTKDSRLYVPVRFLAEALEGRILFKETKDVDIVRIYINKDPEGETSSDMVELPTRLFVDDKEVSFSANKGRPFISSKRTFVPIRLVSEEMGFKVDYEYENNRLIIIEDGEKTLKMNVGANKATINGREVLIDEDKNIRPIVKGNRSYVPMRFVAEMLGREIDYNYIDKTHIVKLYIDKDQEDSDGELEVIEYVPNYEEVPILMLHDIGKGPFSISEKQFRRQMKLIKNQGYTTIFMSDLNDYIEKGIKLPEKPIVITFDDGYESNYSKAYPILKELDMKATIYVIGHSFGRDSYKNTGKAIIPHFGEKEAREMLESGLIDIQSHSFDMHQSEKLEKNKPVRIHVGKFDKESNKEYIKVFKEDFERENELIKLLTGKDLHSFSYPRGYYTDQSEEILYHMGIKSTLTTDKGSNTVVKGLPESIYGLRRINIDKNLSDGKLLELIK